MNNLGTKIIGGAIALVASWYIGGFHHFSDGDYYIDAETDSYVTEMYLEDPDTSIPSLTGWLESADRNRVWGVDRPDALELSQTLKTRFGIDLLACVESYSPEEIDTFFAPVGGGASDHKEIAVALRDSIPEESTIEFGDSWLLVHL